jgi:hypothetical protein
MYCWERKVEGLAWELLCGYEELAAGFVLDGLVSWRKWSEGTQ